ncbi:MAG: TonB-dependent receptor [Polyangiaceae bacterium]
MHRLHFVAPAAISLLALGFGSARIAHAQSSEGSAGAAAVDEKPGPSESTSAPQQAIEELTAAPPAVVSSPSAAGSLESTPSVRTLRVHGPEKTDAAPPVDATAAAPRAPAPEEIVASALWSGGSALPPERAAAHVVVFSREDLTKAHIHSLAQALESVPGLYVTDDGSVTQVAVRGVGGGLYGGTRRLRFSINGVPVSFRPEQRAFLGPEFVPFEAIERIELVLGPVSSLYGPGAELGAVNVVTRKAGASKTSASVLGSFENRNKASTGFGGSAWVNHQGEVANLTLAVSAYSLDRSGLQVERSFASQDPSQPRYAPFFAGPSADDIAAPAAVFAQVEVPTEAAGVLSVDAGLQELDSNAEFRLGSVLTHRTREALRNQWVALRHENAWGGGFSTRFQVSYSAGRPTRNDRFFLTEVRNQTYRRNFAYRALDSNIALEYAIRERYFARVGFSANVEFQDIPFYVVTFESAQGNREAGESQALVGADSRRVQTFGNRGAFVELEAHPIPALPGLGLLATGRVDRVSLGVLDPPSQLSGRASLSYAALPWVAVKAHYTRGFYAPSSALLYSESGFGISNNLIGNLAPTSGARPIQLESVNVAELSVSAALQRWLRFDGSVFDQRLSRKIEFLVSGSDFVGRNGVDQATRGAELSLGSQLGPVGLLASGAFISPRIQRRWWLTRSSSVWRG